MTKCFQMALMLVLTIALTVPVYAHSGGLNSEGCHKNRKTGEKKKDKEEDSPTSDNSVVTDRTADGEIKAGQDFQLSRALDLIRGLSVYRQDQDKQ